MFSFTALKHICALSCCLHFIYASLFAHIWAQGWSVPVFSELLLFCCWTVNLVSMTVSHSGAARAGPNAAAVPQVAKPFLSIPVARFLQSPEERHSSAVPGSIRAVWEFCGQCAQLQGHTTEGGPLFLIFFYGTKKIMWNEEKWLSIAITPRFEITSSLLEMKPARWILELV